jgi:hypothetical protein
MPADSASAAHCNAREFGTSGGQPSAGSMSMRENIRPMCRPEGEPRSSITSLRQWWFAKNQTAALALILPPAFTSDCGGGTLIIRKGTF